MFMTVWTHLSDSLGSAWRDMRSAGGSDWALGGARAFGTATVARFGQRSNYTDPQMIVMKCDGRGFGTTKKKSAS